MRRALNLLRQSIHYRRVAFDEGLTRIGFRMVSSLPDPEPGDLLLIWNRYAGFNELAGHFERCGAKVLVTENGPMGKDWRGREWFSLALGHHAGAGSWIDAGPERWDSWGIELKPWQTGERLHLILGQRGIGEPGIASPDLWAEVTQKRIGGRIRRHPGLDHATSLEDELIGTGSVVTWNSGAALKALKLGVAVWYEFPQWIGTQAARPLSEWGAEPKRDDADRLAMFRRMAWSMFTLDEIRTGEPIARLTTAH